MRSLSYMHIPRDLKEKLSATKNIAVLFHTSPDGDAVGSALALARALKNHGKHAVVISPDAIPEYLQWLPGTGEIIRADTNPEEVRQALENAGLIFMLDHNNFSRAGKWLEKILEKIHKDKTIVMIDHHLQPDTRVDFIFSDPARSSTAEMVYDFILDSGLGPVDEKIATQLYTGIMTDTGSFKFDKTTGNTHRIVADLIEKGAPNSAIHTHVYDVQSYDQLQLLAEALKRMKLIEPCKTSYIALDEETLKKYNYKPGDTEGIVNYGLSLKDVLFTALITEKPGEDKIRFSFRSKGDFDVNAFARRYFEGGGHKNAAGGNFHGSMEDAVKAFEKAVKENCDRIRKTE